MKEKQYEICLRLSQAEKEWLERSARLCGLSKSAYLRRLILGSQVKARPSREIRELRTEVHKIGNNINSDRPQRQRRHRHSGGRQTGPVPAEPGL